MKFFHLFFIYIISSNYTLSQDTIYKKSGEKVVAKILELTPTEVKYKRFDFQDGPLYIESKANVTSIIYSNGIKETVKIEEAKSISAPADYYSPLNTTSNKIIPRRNEYIYKNQYYNEREIQDFLLETKNKTIIGYVTKARQAKRWQYIGFAAIPLGIVGGYALGSSNTYNLNGTLSTNKTLATLGGLCLAGAIACPIGSGIFKYNRKEYNRKAIKLYNDTY